MPTDLVRRINLGAVACEPRPQLPDGFRRNSTRVGATLGAVRSGLSVYELPPGQAVSPYHYEEPEEEWLLVVSGAPTLRHPDTRTVGSRLLPRRSRRCAPRAKQQRVNRPRRDVLVRRGNGRHRRLPGHRHGLGLDSRRRSRPHCETKQRRGRRGPLDCWRNEANDQT